jgi:hypothetical protein
MTLVSRIEISRRNFSTWMAKILFSARSRFGLPSKSDEEVDDSSDERLGLEVA